MSKEGYGEGKWSVEEEEWGGGGGVGRITGHVNNVLLQEGFRVSCVHCVGWGGV